MYLPCINDWKETRSWNNNKKKSMVGPSMIDDMILTFNQGGVDNNFEWSLFFLYLNIKKIYYIYKVLSYLDFTPSNSETLECKIQTPLNFREQNPKISEI